MTLSALVIETLRDFIVYPAFKILTVCVESAELWMQIKSPESIAGKVASTAAPVARIGQ